MVRDFTVFGSLVNHFSTRSRLLFFRQKVQMTADRRKRLAGEHSGALSWSTREQLETSEGVNIGGQKSDRKWMLMYLLQLSANKFTYNVKVYSQLFLLPPCGRKIFLIFLYFFAELLNSNIQYQCDSFKLKKKKEDVIA